MKSGLLSIGKLARYARVSRTALIYYDKMGLLSPVARDDNGYRYYSYRQVATINLISFLQDMGMPLREIQSVIRNRTPKLITELIDSQDKLIGERIAEMERSRKLLRTLKEIIETAVSEDENTVSLKNLQAEDIILGPQIDYSDGKTIEDATLGFYQYCEKAFPGMDLNYPVWGTYSRDRIIGGDWVGPDRFYFRRPGGGDKRPKGLYAVGYGRGNYGQTAELYSRVIEYIENNGLSITGDAYEEYPLNEISIANPNDYLIRLSITVS